MWHPRTIFLSSAIGVMALLCFWFCFGRTQEPRFEGRSLSEWLEPALHFQYENAMIAGGTFVKFNEAMQMLLWAAPKEYWGAITPALIRAQGDQNLKVAAIAKSVFNRIS